MTFISNLLCYHYLSSLYADLSFNRLFHTLIIVTIVEALDHVEATRLRIFLDIVYLWIMWADGTVDYSWPTLLLNGVATLGVFAVRKFW